MALFHAGLAAALTLATALPAPPSLETRTPLGTEVRIELGGAPGLSADTSLHAAFDRVVESERLLRDTVEALNRASGENRAVPVDGAVASLLLRAEDFCAWSQGAISPLGGNLRDHWRAVAGSNPPPAPPPGAITSAACNHFHVDGATGTVSIVAGSRVDLTPFARGFAVDRAVALLRERGVASGRVVVGRVQRAFGTAPGGSVKKPGWFVELPQFEGFDTPLGSLTLTDQSLAILWRREETEGQPLAFDHRTGLPADGVWATLAISELAVDAEALAATALAMGSREGRYRMASLKPEPQVLWLLGHGVGRPLLEEVRWPLSGKRR